MAASIEMGHQPAEELWRDKESSMLGFVCSMLVDIRDHGYMKMDLGSVFKALELGSIEKLRKIEWLSAESLTDASRYVRSLPGYVEGLDAEVQSSAALEAHDWLRFGMEMPIKRALGMGFGDHAPIAWDKIPKSRAQKLAIEERAELQAWLDRKPKKTRRRL